MRRRWRLDDSPCITHIGWRGPLGSWYREFARREEEEFESSREGRSYDRQSPIGQSFYHLSAVQLSVHVSPRHMHRFPNSNAIMCFHVLYDTILLDFFLSLRLRFCNSVSSVVLLILRLFLYKTSAMLIPLLCWVGAESPHGHPDASLVWVSFSVSRLVYSLDTYTSALVLSTQLLRGKSQPTCHVTVLSPHSFVYRRQDPASFCSRLT